MLVEVVGWAAAGCLLLAYGLLSAKRITAGVTYQLLNLAGAVGLAANAVAHGAWPSATLNAVWLVIGLVALRAERRRLRVTVAPAGASPSRSPSSAAAAHRR